MLTKPLYMMKLIFAGLFLLGLSVSCNKRTEGICYCSYFSGDKKEFDLRHLERQQQKDTCAQISQNASHFAGSCKLK